MSTRNPYKLGQSYKSVDEAFKTADYATGLWKCESEWDRTKPMLACILAFIFGVGIIYIFCMGIVKWLS
jgi:hypothetical protein